MFIYRIIQAIALLTLLFLGTALPFMDVSTFYIIAALCLFTFCRAGSRRTALKTRRAFLTS